MTYDFRRVAVDVSTPSAAADVIRAKLEPLFGGNFFNVFADRGVLVEFARMDPEQHVKQQWTRGFGSVPEQNMHCSINIAPSPLGSGAWRDLNLKFAGRPEEERELKAHGISIRKASGLTPEKAVASVIKWFTGNAAKLKGQ